MVLTSTAVALAVTAWLVPAFDHVTVALRQDGFSYDRALDQEQYEAISFNQEIHFDEPNLWGEISLPLLFGSGRLDGNVTYRGSPANVSIRAFVGDYWRTKTVRTGDDGKFSLNVPAGDIEINRLEFDYWFDKPSDGQHRLIVVESPKTPFSGSFFDHAEYAERIPSNGKQQLNLEIVDFIKVLWPVHGVTEQKGDKNTRLIAWPSIDGAAYYELTVSKYRGDRSIARGHYLATVISPQIALTDFPLVESEERVEFYILVRAFSQDQIFLSTSRSGFGDTSFWIPGYTIKSNVER